VGANGEQGEWWTTAREKELETVGRDSSERKARRVRDNKRRTTTRGLRRPRPRDLHGGYTICLRCAAVGVKCHRGVRTI